MSEPKRMTPAEILAANDEILVGKLQDACECADNVDAEQQHDGSWVGSVSTCTSCLAAFAIRRLAAAKASAEADRDAEKAGAETLDIAAMDANDKLGKLAALVIDMQVASPYGQKVKAYARYCMNSGPDPLREAYPHEQEGSISAPLIARAETAEAKLRDARGLAEAARVIVNSTSKLNRHGIPDTDMETIQLGKIRALSRALSNPE